MVRRGQRRQVHPEASIVDVRNTRGFGMDWNAAIGIIVLLAALMLLVILLRK
jgi:hypothetical protein